jgi:hypothetical protein
MALGKPTPKIKVTRAAAKEEATAKASGTEYDKAYKIKIKGKDAPMRASGSYEKIKIKQIPTKKYEKLYAKGPGRNVENQSKTGGVVRKDLKAAGIGDVATKRVRGSSVMNQKSNLNIRGKVKKALGKLPQMNVDERATKGHQTFVAKETRTPVAIKPTVPPVKTPPEKTIPPVTVPPKETPVVTKREQEGTNFNSEFAKARKSGQPTFTYQGKKYTTEIDTKAQPSKTGTAKAKIGTEKKYYVTEGGKERAVTKEEYDRIQATK